MDKDRINGAANQAKGAVKEAVETGRKPRWEFVHAARGRPVSPVFVKTLLTIP